MVKKVFLFNLPKYSNTSSLMASGLVAIAKPTTLSKFKIVSYLSFKISRGAWVLVLA